MSGPVDERQRASIARTAPDRAVDQQAIVRIGVFRRPGFSTSHVIQNLDGITADRQRLQVETYGVQGSATRVDQVAGRKVSPVIPPLDQHTALLRADFPDGDPGFVPAAADSDRVQKTPAPGKQARPAVGDLTVGAIGCRQYLVVSAGSADALHTAVEEGCKEDEVVGGPARPARQDGLADGYRRAAGQSDLLHLATREESEPLRV